MARLFDKDPPTVWPADLPLPYNSENHPPSVRVTAILILLRLAINISCWLANQDLYPDRVVDVELSHEDSNGQEKPTGDDAKGEGVPPVETLAPNPIGSSLAGESCPSVTDRTTATAPSGGG
jgi:hypothetical protein